jgi:hypothetical protein
LEFRRRDGFTPRIVCLIDMVNVVFTIQILLHVAAKLGKGFTVGAHYSLYRRLGGFSFNQFPGMTSVDPSQIPEGQQGGQARGPFASTFGSGCTLRT